MRLIELIILILLAINSRSDHDINMWLFHIQGLKITIYSLWTPYIAIIMTITHSPLYALYPVHSALGKLD